MNDTPQAGPCVTTALLGSLHALEKHVLDRQVAIEAWFRAQWRRSAPPVYCSVDLRNAGFKLAPVDTNLFPAGFNNLNPSFIPLCIQAIQSTVERISHQISRILLIPENHTRNTFYLENIAALRDILIKAGFEVRIGSLLPDLDAAKEIKLPSGAAILLEPLTRDKNRIAVDDFSPCMILLNNDLAEGVPDILQDLEQAVFPPLSLGWSTRLKSVHFQNYRLVSEAFSEQFALDNWLIAPLFRSCGEVDFMKKEGLECLEYNSQALLRSIQKRYDHYGIKQKPFVVVKADSGTYGMAVMMIKDASEIRQLNRKQRTHMAAAKGGLSVTKTIIQEGVYTFETWGENNAVAEPVVYMIGKDVVGGFYRVHAKRGIDENLNAPGMHFEPLSFSEACNNPCCNQNNDANRFYVYGVVARLAALASAWELNRNEEAK